MRPDPPIEDYVHCFSILFPSSSLSLPISRGMASAADITASRAARFTEQTRSMFRAILAENGIADTNDTILQQEIVMFFKLGEWHLWAIRFELTVFSPFTSNQAGPPR
jgi:hypothetical protein